MSIVTVMLVIEYRFFKQQALAMLVLKDDYQNHLVAINKVLDDYNKTKDQLEQLESQLDDQKKKLINTPVTTDSLFPEGAKVYSSDDEPEDDKESFITINRELEYLKQSSLKYLKKHKLDVAFQRTDQHDAWCDYTEHILHTRKNEQQRGTKRSKKKKRKRVSGNKLVREKRQTFQKKREQIQKEHDIDFVWPIERSNFWLSSMFGPRKNGRGQPSFHYGIDMAAVRGTPVHAAAAGVVVEARNAPGYGKTIVIAHDRKYRTRYAHLHTINVQVGQNVTPSTMIGRVGATGCVRSKHGGDPSHLHFEVYVFGKKVNPMYFF